MAQKRYHNYKRPIISLHENNRLLGVLKPGRYQGFDVFTPTGLNFTIGHSSASATPEIDIDQQSSAPMGSWMSPQGTIIKEDAPIPLVVDTNEGNANTRIDVIYGEHYHVPLVEGQPAIYGVIKGSVVSTVIPSLSSPNIQVILGILIIPAGAIDLSEATYVPKTKPGEVTGEILMRNSNQVPVGFALCTGTGFTSDGQAIPNLQGRFVVGHNPSDSDYSTIGNTGPNSSPLTEIFYNILEGGKKIAHRTFGLAKHVHGVEGPGYKVQTDPAGPLVLSKFPNAGDEPFVDVTGGIARNVFDFDPAAPNENYEGAPIENRPPYYTVCYLIRL